LIQRKYYSVGKHLLEFGVGQELFEPFQADPFAAHDAVSGPVIPEGDLNAVHGPIMKNKQVDQGEQDQHMQLPIAADPNGGILQAASTGWRGMFPDRFYQFVCHFIHPFSHGRPAAKAGAWILGSPGRRTLPGVDHG